MIGLHYDYDKSVPSFYFQQKAAGTLAQCGRGGKAAAIYDGVF